MPIALFVLGLTVFSLGTTEFMIAGLLPELAAGFGVSVPDAGLLISLFAVGVVIGAPAMTMLTARVPKKATLVTLLVVFVLGESLAAAAPSYGVLMAARVLTAISHGAFFGIGAVVAANLVPEGKKARAIATMFGGLTIATIAGVPLGTFIGQHFGWRTTFWAVAVLGLISLVGVSTLVPHQPRGEQPGIRNELSAFANPKVWLALATTMLSQAGLYAAYTYIAPLLINVTEFPRTAVAPLLMLFGVGSFLGTVLGGRFADRGPMTTLTVGLVLLSGILLLFSVTAHNGVTMIATLALFGVAGFLINPALQTRVMNESAGAPTLTSASNISAFNIGNALGPWLAGLGISSGLGYLAPSWIGAALAGAASLTALVGVAADQRQHRTAATSAAAGARSEPAVSSS
ncbi:MFS transporter, DHA1 family, arabinose polymer transporter [Actinopolyspora xinjiangensis]|uniref:MFS transporter, DHA1 family, arabinose polymer transporter n=1 Tax=Actinopolyspora xinjiangensis TaxID=405564 RepID=A0A1H0VLQ3_9ACTN|nr:Cmx/CmrA family chloramphenicol efflux MFS transporter [Actinopolyspora xinjiangensis]SDP79125.1 MFS transporter, DHA1 family, arabinose polymer transporter [Actinopolyspora xinjiangensis]